MVDHSSKGPRSANALRRLDERSITHLDAPDTSTEWESKTTAAKYLEIRTSSQLPARRLLRLLAFAAAGLLVFYALALAARNVTTLVDLQSSRFDGTVAQGQFEDYVAFYSAGKLVLEGNGADIYDIDVLAATEHDVMGREVGGTGTLAFFNPPFVALFFAPLALLPVATAALVLLILNIILLAIAGATLHHHMGIRKRWVSAAFWLAVASFESVFWLIGHNQLSMSLALGFLSFYSFQREDKPVLSGFALAFLLIKPQAALLALVILVWKRQWQALASFSAVACVLVMASIAVSGPSVLWDYPRFLIESTGWEGSRGIDTQGMYGWNGFFSTLTPYRGTLHILLTATATLATLGVVLFTFRGRWQPSSTRFPLAIGVLALGSLLTNPHVYLQDTVLLGLALVLGFVGWHQSREVRAMWLALSVVTWFLLSRTMELQAESNLNLVTPLAAGMFLMLARGALQQDSTEVDRAPKSSVYGISEPQQAKSRMAS
jgi:Glycosyltransferase family 87